LTQAEAATLAAGLELDVDDIAICHACLSFVSFALDSGDEQKVAGAITRVAPDLWAEGLAQPVRTALERARERGVTHAAQAVAAIDGSGPGSQVVRAIIRRLAADLSARAKGDLLRMGWEPWPPLVQVYDKCDTNRPEMTERAISLRLDEETARALELLMRGGKSRSEAVREAVVETARRRLYEIAAADAARIAADENDRHEVAEIQALWDALSEEG
jgi:Arc/MetJ-type ribon-helix-helix transcriptional regulator